MKSRGRRSASEVIISDGPNGVVTDQRPDAPPELDDLEADEWRALVRTMPPGHFARTHYPILTQLCRHIASSHRLAQMISVEVRKKNLDSEHYIALLAAQVRESGIIVRIERSMRLTQMSTINASAVKKLRPVTQVSNAPWNKLDEDEDEEAAAA